MEQELIRFAKVHGYINAFVMMYPGIALAVSFPALRVVGFAVPVIALWSIIPIAVVGGCATESAGMLKPAGFVYTICSIVGCLLLFFKIADSRASSWSVPLGTLAVSLYGVYVLGFLEKLFNTLNQRRVGIIAITAIVCNEPSSDRLPIEQPEIPLPPSSQIRPESEVVAESTTTAAAPETQPKEFPTWT